MPCLGRGRVRSVSARAGALAVLLAMGLPGAFASGQRPVASSLLLLIDTSGSMGDPIGSADPEVKIEVAKRAAVDALGRAASGGSVEVAVLAFSGDCGHPVPQFQDFTRDVALLRRFVESLQPGGRTPMAAAVQFANRFMSSNGAAGAADRMIMLLADGQNDCGDIDQALAELQAAGVIFRHETVGFGITPNSAAADDLRKIATETGGTYHHAADATQLADVFMEFVSTLTVIDLLGRIGAGPSAPGAASGATPGGTPAAGPGSAGQAGSQAGGGGAFGSLIGRIRANPARDSESAVNPPPESGRPLWGSLAMEADQGPAWGWSIDDPTPEAAYRNALSGCGNRCEVVMSFSDECAALAADQTPGSTARGWAKVRDNEDAARTMALDACRGEGGMSCAVLASGCTQRPPEERR